MTDNYTRVWKTRLIRRKQRSRQVIRDILKPAVCEGVTIVWNGISVWLPRLFITIEHRLMYMSNDVAQESKCVVGGMMIDNRNIAGCFIILIVLCFLHAITLRCPGEEMLPVNLIPECERLFLDLPEYPTEQQAAEFWSIMNERVVLYTTVPKDFTISSNLTVPQFARPFYGYLTQKFCWEHIYLSPSEEEASRGKGANLPSYKWVLMNMTLIRLVLEGRTAPENADRDNIDNRRSIAFSMLLTFVNILNKMPHSYHPKFAQADRFVKAEIDKSPHAQELIRWGKLQVAQEYNALSIQGETIRDKISSWRVLFDRNDNTFFRHCALLSWAYANIKPADMLRSKAFTFPPSYKGRMKVLVEHYGEPEVFRDIIPLFIESGDCLRNKTPFSAHFLIGYLFYAILDDFSKCRQIPNWQFYILSSIPPILSSECEYLLTDDALSESRHAVEKLRAFLRSYDYSSKSDRLRLIDQGTAGEAWFAGSYCDFGATDTHIASDNIFPQYHIITNNTGKQVIIAYGISISDLLCTGDHLVNYKFFCCAKADPVHRRTYKIEKALAAERFPDDTAKIIADDWGKRFCKGIPSLFSPLSLDAYNRYFVPAVFYRYARTNWKLYVLSRYRADFDIYWHDEPVCVVELSPAEDEMPAEVKLGLIHREMDNWLFKTGVSCNGRTVWNAYEFKEEQKNKPLFDRAKALCDVNATDRDAKWLKNAQKIRELCHDYE